jgi:hypothetical protein
MGLQFLNMPPVAASDEKRLRWMTSTGGSVSMSTVVTPFPALDGPTCATWDCDSEMRASAS